jgi:hypothetical protein
MAFSMKIDNSKIEGMDIMPSGHYEVKLVSFNPKTSKKGDSFNLNPCMVLVNHVEFANRKVYATLNSMGAFMWPDFSHCFGLPMETDGKESWLPGTWNGDPAKYNPQVPETWVYKGPLVGRVGKIILAVDNYNGQDSNKIERYFCAIADCATKFPKTKHSVDLLKNSKK